VQLQQLLTIVMSACGDSRGFWLTTLIIEPWGVGSCDGQQSPHTEKE